MYSARRRKYWIRARVYQYINNKMKKQRDYFEPVNRVEHETSAVLNKHDCLGPGGDDNKEDLKREENRSIKGNWLT